MKATVAIILIMLFIAGCGGDILERQAVYNGIEVNLQTANGALSGSKYDELCDQAMKLMRERLELPGNSAYGEIERLNRDRGPTEITAEAYQLLELAVRFHKETRGMWDYRLGEIERMWMSGDPDDSELDAAVNRAHQTAVVLSDGNRASIKGDGIINLRRLVIGWAVDGAADLLIGGGVESGMVSAGTVHRCWGTPDVGAWSVNINLPDNDATFYTIKSAAGALCIVKGVDNPADTPFVMVDANGGYLLIDQSIVTAWSPTAVQAATFAEAMYVMGRQQAFAFLRGQDSVGMFYLFPDKIGFIGESNNMVAPWVSVQTK